MINELISSSIVFHHLSIKTYNPFCAVKAVKMSAQGNTKFESFRCAQSKTCYEGICHNLTITCLAEYKLNFQLRCCSTLVWVKTELRTK